MQGSCRAARGRAGPGWCCRIPPASSVFAHGYSRLLPQQAMEHRRPLLHTITLRQTVSTWSSCVIRCLRNTLFTCQDVPGSPSAFLCRVKGHTHTLCVRRRGSPGTRLGLATVLLRHLTTSYCYATAAVRVCRAKLWRCCSINPVGIQRLRCAAPPANSEIGEKELVWESALLPYMTICMLNDSIMFLT